MGAGVGAGACVVVLGAAVGTAVGAEAWPTDAALHPADTNYIYFVLTGTDGSQTFTSSYAEFERAKQKSKEVLGQ